ncbi:hypothetical protein HanRHA438_Chr07g0322611 [Helianthus annuus]|nr:hypothetical protein HanRHA438_Chr07g0322611 [Helianthus annuus]
MVVAYDGRRDRRKERERGNRRCQWGSDGSAAMMAAVVLLIPTNFYECRPPLHPVLHINQGFFCRFKCGTDS